MARQGQSFSRLDRRQIESILEKLRESEERYRRLVEHSPEAIAVHVQGRLVYVNPAGARLVGADSPKELIGRSIFDFVPPQFTEIARARMKQVQQEGQPAELLEEKLLTLGGELIDVEIVAIPVTFETQRGSQLVIRDISQRKRAEQALRETEEKYRSIVEKAPFGIFQTTPDGRFLSANDALARMLGYASAAQLMAEVQDIGAQVHVDPGQRAEFARLLEQDEYVSGFESQVRRRDGNAIWISLIARTVRDRQGDVLYYEGMVEEITARKRTEARLTGQYEVNRLLAEAPGIAEAIPGVLRAICETLNWDLGQLWMTDDDAEVLRCIESWSQSGTGARRLVEISRKMGLPRGVGLPGRVWMNEKPAWVSEIREDPDFVRTVASDVAFHSAFAFPVVLRERARGVLEFFSREPRAPDEQMMAAMTATGDQLGQFMERAQAEEAVRTRERQQAAVARLGSEAIKGTPIQELMEQATELLGQGLGVEYTKVLELLPGGEELLLRAGAGWREGLVGTARVPASSESQAGYTLSAREPVIVRDLATDSRFQGPPLLTEHAVVSGMSVIIPGRERPFGVLGAHTKKHRIFTEDDINFMLSVANVLAEAIERARSVDVARQEETKTAAIVNTAVDGIITIDASGVIQSFNPAASRIFGYSPEEVIGRKINILMPPPERGEHDSYIQNYMRTGVRKIIGIGREVVGQRKDGSRFPMDLAISEVRLGDQLLFTGTVRDISERKREEEERERLLARIQAERERVNNLVGNVPGVVWEAYGQPDQETQRIDFVSDYVETMLGYSVEEWLSTPNFWLTIVHPEDRERAGREAADIYAGKREGISEFRWTARDGRVVWVEAKSVVIHDEDGNPIGMRGVTMDITDRKLAEERQRVLAEASSILSASSDYHTALQQVASLTIGKIGDVCLIELASDGTIRRAAVAHSDPGMQRLLSTLGHDRAINDLNPSARVLSELKPELHPEVSDTLLARLAPDPEYQQIMRRLGLRSLLMVPISAGGHGLGTIMLASAGQSQYYTPADLAFGEELARRVGIAIDNARSYAAEQAARRKAEEAADRTARLQAVTAGLSEALTAAQVGECVIDAALSGLQVRSGVIVRLGPGRRLSVVTAKGATEDFRSGWESFVARPPKRVIDALNTGEPIFAASSRDLIKRFPEISVLLSEDLGFACVPLCTEGRTTGTMVLTFEENRRMEEEREFILALAGQCAQALERSRLYEAEQQARRTAEQAAERITRLQATTAALSEAATPAQVAGIIIEQVMTAMDSAAGAIALVNEQKNELEIVAHRGYQEDTIDQWPIMPLQRARSLPLVQAVRQNRAIFIESPEAAAAEYPALVQMDTSARTWAAIPLSAGKRAVGGLLLSHSESRTFTREDRFLLLTLAWLGAQALERARLYEDEQAARAEAEAAEQRQAFLAKASAILSSSLDYEITLASLAQLCVPYIADWCVIDILGDEGKIKRVALAHSDERWVRIAHDLQRRYPPDPHASIGVAKVLRTSEPEFYPEVTEELLQAATPDAELADELRRFSLKSYISVPLQARGRTMGVLTLVTAESGRQYTEEDLEFAQDLARRAGLAVDNAALYSESQRIQEELRIANEAKDEFLGMVSHELRTPITTIYGGSRLLASQIGRLDEESRAEILRDIGQEAERLHRIVEDLLVLARMELGQALVMEPVLVQRVIEKTAEVLIKRRPLRKVLVHCDSDLDPVAASPGYLEQILRNLLSNADKYSPMSEPIDVLAKSTEDGQIMITVADRGPGIPPEEAELIFERFYRAGNTAKQAGGAGIGLTVCKRLVEAQSGRIWARLRDGGGTEVSFSLPVYEDNA